ncbi:MAG: amidohydrolase family protein, partial [Candidatus Enteromonas sp.]|nr:amidohydrolase family protein [Candidatus Enteromonas sp.]
MSKNELVELAKGYIVVDKEKVVGTYQELPKEYEGIEVVDYGECLIIPSFSDLHVHAPQYPNRGIAMDLLLNDWLNEYTFKLEANYKDKEFAKKVYAAFVNDLIKHGTMHASIFATIHNEATDILVDYLEEKGISSFVG